MFPKVKLFRRAEDLYDVMVPVFLISKLLGLAPFYFNRKSRILKPHFGVVTVIRFVLIVGTMCYICFVMDELNFTQNMGGMALRYELYFSTLLTAVVMVLAMTNQKLAVEAIEEIVEIDDDFKLMGQEVSYRNAQIFAYAQIIYMVGMFLMKVILQPFANSLAYLTIYSIFNLVDLINTTMLFQYVNVLLLMRQRFIWVNREVKNLAELSKNKNTERRRPKEKRKRQLVHVVSQCSEDYRFLSAVVDYGRIHNRLNMVCKMTNRIFGIQLLVTITIRFIMITTQLINTYKVIQDPNLASSVTHSMIAIYLFLNCAKLFMVAAVSDNTAAKVSSKLLLYLSLLF